MASSNLQQMGAGLVSRSKMLINNDLKRICREEGLASSGVKAVLQARVIDLIGLAIQNNDHVLFNRLQHRVSHRGEAPPSPLTGTNYPPPSYATTATPNGKPMSNGYAQSAYGSYQQPPPPSTRSPYMFKESPFFEMRELIAGGIVLEASPSHRQTQTKNIALSDTLCARLKSDPTLRLLLFSFQEQPLSSFTRLEIAFPSQIEVRVNGEEVKANYKGLKNKPGSTRPADLTNLFRLSPANYRNSLVVTYALTQKASREEKFTLAVHMVRKFSVEELAKRIKQRNVITKASVLDEMRKKASDPDIVVESSVVSLKDPVSTVKLGIPCRSTLCTHNRCFDAECFLQLQEQAPTWQCPICNKTISFEALAVDEYVQEILDRAPKGTDQVTIEPDGRWSTEKDKASANTNGYGGEESDDDLVDITDFRLSAIKSEAMHTPQSLARTPPLPSREPSSAPRTGNKRTSDVIDLTLSDDDEPARPTKKVAYSTPSSLPDPSRRYQLPSFGHHSMPMRPQAPSRHSMSSGLHVDAPSQSPQRPTYGSYRQQPPPSYPGQGSASYPTYIDSSP